MRSIICFQLDVEKRLIIDYFISDDSHVINSLYFSHEVCICCATLLPSPPVASSCRRQSHAFATRMIATKMLHCVYRFRVGPTRLCWKRGFLVPCFWTKTRWCSRMRGWSRLTRAWRKRQEKPLGMQDCSQDRRSRRLWGIRSRKEKVNHRPRIVLVVWHYSSCSANVDNTILSYLAQHSFSARSRQQS